MILETTTEWIAGHYTNCVRRRKPARTGSWKKREIRWNTADLCGFSIGTVTQSSLLGGFQSRGVVKVGC